MTEDGAERAKVGLTALAEAKTAELGCLAAEAGRALGREGGLEVPPRLDHWRTCC